MKYDFAKLDYKRRKELIDNPDKALPFADRTVVATEKFTGYLFGGGKADGLAKGKALSSRLGYNLNNWEELRDEIVSKAASYSS